MKLVRLQATGLKNLSNIDLEVTPFMAFAGPNGSGKTALSHETLQLLLLGYIPELGKTLPAIRQHAAGDGEIIVAGTWDTGFGIRRRIAASMDTEVSPPRMERTERDRQARIVETTGSFMPSLDLRAFLDLSAEKRRDVLFKLLPADLVELRRQTYDSWLGYETQDDIGRRSIEKVWAEVLQTAQSPVEGLASALQYVHEKMLAADRMRKDQVKVLAAAEADAQTASEAVTYDEQESAKLRAELESVTKQMGEIDRALDAFEAAATKERQRLHDVAVLQLKISELEERIADADSKIAAMQEAEGPSLEALRATFERADAKARAQRDAVKYVTAIRAGAVADLAAAVARSERLKGEACPTCGGTVQMPAARSQAEADANEARQRTYKADEDVAAAEAMQKELDGELALAASALRTAGDVQGRRGILETARAGYVERLALNRQRLEGLSAQTPLPEPPDNTQQELLRVRAAEVNRLLAAQERAAREAGKAERDRERADAERKRLDELTYRSDQLKSIHSGLQGYRATVLQQMVEPVAKVAGGILAAIDPDKTFRFIFEREERDTFDFGFEERGEFRGFKSASTGEAAFLAVVFTAALIAVVQPPWRLLRVDNVESIDPERLRWLLVTLGRMQDRFDNIIVSGCCAFPKDLEDLTVVDVREVTRPQLKAV